MPMYSVEKENTLLSLDDDKENGEKGEKMAWSINTTAEGINFLYSL